MVARGVVATNGVVAWREARERPYAVFEKTDVESDVARIQRAERPRDDQSTSGVIPLSRTFRGIRRI